MNIKHILNLLTNFIRSRQFEVNLVEYRDDNQICFKRHVEIGYSLSLYTLQLNKWVSIYIVLQG